MPRLTTRLVAGSVVLLIAACGGESVPRYSAAQFFATTSYGLPGSAGHAFSADGSRLLVHSDSSGVFNVYALAVDGADAVALTASDEQAMFAVSWFPRDERILYTHDQGGDELNHVLVREPDGSHRDLTPGEDLKAEFVGWSDDGRHAYIATTERNPQHFDLYRYSSADYSRELIFENSGFQLAAISRDGRWLALDKPRTSADADIYVVDFEADPAKPMLITAHEGNIAHGAVTFTPDNRRLVYATNEHGEFSQHWSYDLASGERTALVTADWDVMYTVYSSTGRYRASGINADARTRIVITDTASGERLNIPPLPPGSLNSLNSLNSLRTSRDDRQLAVIVNGDASPSDIHVIDLEAGTSRALTDALDPGIDRQHLVTSEIVRYDSFDGLEIPALLYKPQRASAANPVPALVWVHGGPGGQSRTGYSAVRQHLVNHGYAILAANNRGSSGYGKTFFHMDDRRHGDVDLKDIVYGRKYLSTGWTASESASSAAPTAATWWRRRWPSSPRHSTSASIFSASRTGCARCKASRPGGKPSRKRSTTRWATRPPTSSGIAGSHRFSTPTTSSSHCSSYRAPRIRASSKSRAMNSWPHNS